MKRIFILGSTGSIGTSALDVIKNHGSEFELAGIGANSSIDLLRCQAFSYRPDIVWIGNKDNEERFSAGLARPAKKVFSGIEDLSAALCSSRADLVLLAISGSAALRPLMETLDLGIDVALANKEALVMAGRIVMKRSADKKASILPVDSEQSAIWQCLERNDSNDLQRIYLTASGGPLRGISAAKLRGVSLKDVLRHPRWKMGRKITVDSATLMNKGLEVIEAVHLFGVHPGKVEVVVHPEAIVHSMVGFSDGVVMAQLSVPDMRIPIQYAFSYPRRIPGSSAGLDFFKLGKLTFEKPDRKTFRCLDLAYAAVQEAGTMPVVLNAANEICVNSFLDGGLAFSEIPVIVERVMEQHKTGKDDCLEPIFAADTWARLKAESLIRGKSHSGR